MKTEHELAGPRALVDLARPLGEPAAPKLTSSPLLAALKRAGTHHVYGDTADTAELARRISAGRNAILSEVDGNTVNQPLLQKVLRELLENGDPVGRAARLLDPGERLRLPSIYALLCGRVGNRMTREFAAGRRWEVSLQLHMALGSRYADAIDIAQLVHAMVPNAFIKVPFRPDQPQSLLVARDLERAGVQVNVTSTFSARQVVMAALLAEASRTNVFMGRIEKGLEAHLLGEEVVLVAQRELRKLRSRDGVRTELIVASMHDWRSFERLAGCDVFTAPPDVLGGFLEQEEVEPADLASRVETSYGFKVSGRVMRRLGPASIVRLSTVEPEFVEFLRDLRRWPGWLQLTDGDELYERFDSAGFADVFHPPTESEKREAHAGKLPDLDGKLVDRVPLDTHYSLLANADFENHQARIDAEIEKRL